MEVIPTTAPATPAAGVIDAPAAAATQAPARIDPFDPAYLQKRVDDFLKARPAAAAALTTPPAPAPAAAAASTEVKPDAAAPAATTEAKPAADAAKPDAAASTTAEAKPDAVAAPAAAAADASAEASAAPDLSLVVELPPRNAGAEPLRIAAPDKATAEALRRLQNGYMRGEDARAMETRVEEREQRLQEVEIALSSDPLSVIERIPEQQRLQVARQVLAEHFDALRDDIEAWWNDESKRRVARAEGLEARQTARGQYQERLAVAQQVKAIRTAVTGLIPEGTNPDEAQEFYTDSLRYLASVADGRPTGMISDKEVSTLLASRIKRYGFVKPVATAAAAQPVTAASPVAPAASQTSVPAVTDVAKAHATQQARAAAAASTTPGAGATPVTALPKPPKGSTIEQVADFYLQHFKNKGQ